VHSVKTTDIKTLRYTESCQKLACRSLM